MFEPELQQGGNEEGSTNDDDEYETSDNEGHFLILVGFIENL